MNPDLLYNEVIIKTDSEYLDWNALSSFMSVDNQCSSFNIISCNIRSVRINLDDLLIFLDNFDVKILALKET